MPARAQRQRISHPFRKAFPEAAEMADALGLTIRAQPGKPVNGMPTYWLDGTYQLTGYRVNKDGSAFTREDAAKYMRELLEGIAEGRAEVARETRETRFERIINGMKTIPQRYRMFCVYQHQSGDSGTIFPRQRVDAWVYFWDEPHQIARATDVEPADIYSALRTSFLNGGKAVSGTRLARTEAAP